MAVCFPHSLTFGAMVAEDALREVIFKKYKGKFEVRFAAGEAYIKSPYSGVCVADVSMVDVAGDLWACVSLTPHVPSLTGDDVDAFDEAVTRIVKEHENFMRV